MMAPALVFLPLLGACTGGPAPGTAPAAATAAVTQDAAEPTATTKPTATTLPMSQTAVAESPPDIELLQDIHLELGVNSRFAWVDIPAVALYGDPEVRFNLVQAPKTVDSGTYIVISRGAQLALIGEQVFKEPVTVRFNHALAHLPLDLPEANLFIVKLVNDEWVRVQADMDEDANTLTLHTFTPGTWAQAYEEGPNLSSSACQYLKTLAEQPRALEDAAGEAERRFQAFNDAWKASGVTVEHLEGQVLLHEILPNAITRQVLLSAPDAYAIGLQGRGALLTLDGSTVAGWDGEHFMRIEANLNLPEPQAGDQPAEAPLVAWHQAHQRLVEAKAVLQALAHPEQTSFTARDAGLVEDWVFLQSGANPDSSAGLIDWQLTAYPATTKPSQDGTVGQTAPDETPAEKDADAFQALFECRDAVYDLDYFRSEGCAEVFEGFPEDLFFEIGPADLADATFCPPWQIDPTAQNISCRSWVDDSTYITYSFTAFELALTGVETLEIDGRRVESIVFSGKTVQHDLCELCSIDIYWDHEAVRYYDKSSGLLLRLEDYNVSQTTDENSYIYWQLAGTNQPLSWVDE